MLRPRSGIYVCLAERSGRVLHPAKVLRADGRSATARLAEPLLLDVGMPIQILFEAGRRFMQQAARVTAVAAAAPAMVLTFETAGQPASAESREAFRVSTVMADLTATVGDEIGCAVLDVSASGIAVLTRTAHHAGTIVPVEVRHEGRSYAGEACVRSARRSADGRTRCGLRCVERRGHPADLAGGLRLITMDIQRTQLRRLARR